MKLAELEPGFLRVAAPNERYHDVERFDEAQGVEFMCPKCFAASGSPIGVHGVQVWFRDRGVDPSEVPGPARWIASGTSLHDLTLSPSILLTSGCGWHGWIENGEVRTA